MDLWLYSVVFAIISVPVATVMGLYFALRWQREADPFRKLTWGLKGASSCLGVAALLFWFTLYGLLPTLQAFRELGYQLDITHLPAEKVIEITTLAVAGVFGVLIPCVWAICFSLVKFLEAHKGAV